VKSHLAILQRNAFDVQSLAFDNVRSGHGRRSSRRSGPSVLVDIARSAGTDLNSAQRARLDALLAAGLIEFVAPADALEPTRYAVTRQGQTLLDKRGIGANES
jgi:hypothetical protein